MDSYPKIEQECRLRGVSFEIINVDQNLAIYNEIEINNMDIVLLEKPPKIAIYTPPNKQPWDDAVTLALTYAEVPYKTLWDEEVFMVHYLNMTGFIYIMKTLQVNTESFIEIIIPQVGI